MQSMQGRSITLILAMLTIALFAVATNFSPTVADGAVPVADSSTTKTPTKMLDKIFSSLEAKCCDMEFGGDFVAALGLAQKNQNLAARELPPLRGKKIDTVYLFFQLEDDRGYVVVRYSSKGWTAFRFDKDCDLIGAAVGLNGQPVSVLSAAAADKKLSDELSEWPDFAN